MKQMASGTTRSLTDSLAGWLAGGVRLRGANSDEVTWLGSCEKKRKAGAGRPGRRIRVELPLAAWVQVSARVSRSGGWWVVDGNRQPTIDECAERVCVPAFWALARSVQREAVGKDANKKQKKKKEQKRKKRKRV